MIQVYYYIGMYDKIVLNGIIDIQVYKIIDVRCL